MSEQREACWEGWWKNGMMWPFCCFYSTQAQWRTDLNGSLAALWASFCIWVNSSTHFYPITISVLKEIPLVFFFLNLVYLFTKCSTVYFLKPHSVQNVMQPDGSQNPDLCWWSILCVPACDRHLKNLNVLFWCVFLKWQKQRDRDTDTGEKWWGRKWPPNERGIRKGLDFSPPLTLIRSHNIRMCDDDLRQQICMRPNVVLALCRKCEKSSHRKALFASVRAIWQTPREDLYQSNFDMVGTVARVSTIRVGPKRHGRTFLALCVCVQVLLPLGLTVPLSDESS